MKGVEGPVQRRRKYETSCERLAKRYGCKGGLAW